MIVSVMKTTFQKLKSRIVQYTDHTQFSNDDFRKKLLENLSLDLSLKIIFRIYQKGQE